MVENSKNKAPWGTGKRSRIGSFSSAPRTGHETETNERTQIYETESVNRGWVSWQSQGYKKLGDQKPEVRWARHQCKKEKFKKNSIDV